MDRQHVLDDLRLQAAITNCPITSAALAAAADDVDTGGPTWDRLRPHAHLPTGAALPLRLAGAAHRLALAGDAPDYARHLPTCGGDGDAELAAQAFVALMTDDRLDLCPVQTNEPGRLAALDPAFSAVHERTGLPLRLLELGSSAGLLLGRPTAPTVERRGCDRNPLDPVADRLLLLSFVWASQVDRFRRLHAALDEAAAAPATVDRAEADEWLAAQLAAPRPDQATVVFHSVVWMYLPDDTRRAIERTLAVAGPRATDVAPLAYVRFENAGDHAETWVRTWPGGDDRLFATSGFHGQSVELAA